MTKTNTTCLTLIAVASFAATGCQMQRVFYRPDIPASIRAFDGYDVVLAADFIQPSEQQAAPPDDQPVANQDAARGQTEDEQKKPADHDGSKPTKRMYTAPGARYQQFAIQAVSVAAFGISDVSGSGREAAESQIMSPTAIVGRPGLSAPPPTVTNAIVGRPGLQQGFAAGLGPASDRNIFTARMNPLSGTNGRCQDLINAGFFNRDRAACETHFRR